jgi:integrase
VPYTVLSSVDSHERGRDFVTEDEFIAMVQAVQETRYPLRNSCLLMLAYFHGFRASEICRVRLEDLDLRYGRIWVRRLKNSLSTEQPLVGDEKKALKRYIEYERKSDQPWLFVNERGQKMTRSGFWRLARLAGERARIPFPIHPHMLRHGCGYSLANKGYDLRLIQDYLGHRDPQHTVRYTRTAASRFEGLWD